MFDPSEYEQTFRLTLATLHDEKGGVLHAVIGTRSVRAQ